MAYLDKDAYERKREYAGRRMNENVKCKTLTEEQHEVLAWLCRIRHDVHCHQDDFFYSESSNHTLYWDYIDDGNGLGLVQRRLKDKGLPNLHWSFNSDDYMTDSMCCYIHYTEDETENEKIHCHKMANQFNDDIEHYLADIDKKHGTQYCPSGATRIW